MTPPDSGRTIGTLSLLGAKHWIARAAEPYADRVGPDFTLAAFPHRGEVVPEPVAEPRPKQPRARSRAA